MSQFNPGVPDESLAQNPGYFLGSSKAASAYEGDKSVGVALEGLGKVLGDATTGADTAVKGIIQDKVYDLTDFTRQAYTTSLQATKEQGEAGQSTQGVKSPYTQSDSGDVPGNLQTLQGSVETLSTSRAAGKISSTYYWGKLTELAKSLRSEYPGYREYIDQTISGVVGHDPANALVSALTTDINRMASGQTNDVVKKLRTDFSTANMNGVPDADKEWQMFEKTGDTAHAMSFLNKANADIYNSKVSQAKFEGAKALVGVDKLSAEKYLNDDITKSIASNMDTSIRMLGFKTDQDVVNYIQGVKNGSIKASDEEMGQLYQLLQGRRAELVSTLQKKYAGMTTAMGGAQELNSHINAAMAPYDNWIGAISSKQLDLATFNQDAIKARTGDVGKVLLDGTAANGFMMMKQLQDFGGQNAFPTLMRDYLKGKDKEALPGLSAIATSLKAAAITRSDIRIKPMLEQANPPGGTPNPTLNGEIMKIPAMITTPGMLTPEGKANVAKTSFDPANAGVIKAVKPDSFDTYGRLNPGQTTALNNFINPAMTGEMWKLGRTDKTQWDNYKNFAENESSALVGNKIRDLNNIQEIPGVKLRYNLSSNQIEMQVVQRGDDANSAASDRLRGNTGPIKQARDTISALNVTLNNLAEIGKVGTPDASQYIIGYMKGLGLKTDHMETVKGTAQQKTENSPDLQNSTDIPMFADAGNKDTSVAGFVRNPLARR